jgi:hypothetical protein
MEFKGTKGEWKVVGIDYPTIESTSEECRTNPTIASVLSSFRSREEALANAQLIADAGTTINKCDLLPSELLEQRNLLLEALIRIRKSIKNQKLESNFGHTLSYVDEAINKALEL